MNNNYVATSDGIYLFKPVLPMGYKISGEALNSVAIIGEIEKLYNPYDDPNNIGLEISELYNYPTSLVDNSVLKERSMGRSVRKYKRYVDDSHVFIAGNTLQDISDGILAIGFMYGVELTVNIDLGIWKSEFLDAFLWRDIGTNVINTMMKHKLGAPFGHVRSQSDHPDQYKLKTLLGEMLRNRRIASDDGID